MLILPGHPLFDFTLATSLPPNWKESVSSSNSVVFAARADNGILQLMTERELEEYLEGGEWDERLEAVNDDDY